MPFGPPRVIAFDAFGTLVRIADRRNPYRRLFRALGVDPAVAARRAMTADLTLAQLARELNPGHRLDLTPIEADLAAELASVERFADVAPALDGLREAGVRIAVVSNLAAPYVPAVEASLGPWLDVRVYSCRAKHVKPAPEIFAQLSTLCGVPPDEITMVGDSPRSDVAGARAFGMRGLCLVRGRDAPLGPQDLRSLAQLPSAIGQS